jgi:TfoX/Sxy family transcriptional regulator of competence genes
MTAEREALADRIRAALPDDRPVREVSMFGGLSFMVDDSMVVAAGRNGDLLVRVDPARHDELLDVAGAKPAIMGADRPMGPGWVAIAHDGLTTDQQLAFWIQVGMEHRAAQAESDRGPRPR